MRLPVRVITTSYLFSGMAESNDAFLGWLNNPNKPCIDLEDVEGFPLDPTADLRSFWHAAITIPKPGVVAFDLVSAEGAAAVQVAERRETVVVYAGRLVIEGFVHPPGDMPVSHLLNVVGGFFFPVSLAKVHPMTPTRPLPADFSPMMILNRNHVDFYHPTSRRPQDW